MKKTIFSLIIIFCIISCSKNGILPKDKRNNCKDCVINYVDPNGKIVYTLSYSDKDSFAIIDFCNYLEDYKTNYNSTSGYPYGLYKAEIKCN